MLRKDKCFVIMPFGVKPVPDRDGETYDFDKVYRILIRRAVQDAGMEAIRADEHPGSHIIHSDMFKELRDRAVVLADLSLGNPNVYYELGIRHVLSASGTVLICREGTELPFDIRLSRVVFYRFNGRDLDWEVVETVVPQIKAALEHAMEQKPDSPVHALLEKVFPEGRKPLGTDRILDQSFHDSGADLEGYQQIFARLWAAEKTALPSLIAQHGSSMFGSRALGEFCLDHPGGSPEAAEVARLLFKHSQFGLCCRLYDHLRRAESQTDGFHLSPDDLTAFGSALTEKEYSLEAAEQGLLLAREGLRRLGESPTARNRFRLLNSLAGLLLWRWFLKPTPEAQAEAIKTLTLAREAAEEMLASSEPHPMAVVAKLYLRLLIALRKADGMPDRADTEGYREAAIALSGAKATTPLDASFLRWYKAIVFADAGREETLRDAVLQAIREDDIIRQDRHCPVEIGHQQYTMLRRFIEVNLPFLNHHSLMGHISQTLQYALRHREPGDG